MGNLITKDNLYKLDTINRCMFKKYADLVKFGYMLHEESLPHYKAFVNYNIKYSYIANNFKYLVSKHPYYK